MGDHPLIPDYGGACVTNVVPTLLEPPDRWPAWFPDVSDADQVVLLVVDGLGWEQLAARRSLAPVLSGAEGGPITTVAPTTTSTAMTSITTGLPPGEHGVIGYRMWIDGEVLNVLKWATARGDARERIPPGTIQGREAFCGQRPPVVTRAEYRSSGFTMAHMADARYHGFRTLSTEVVEVRRLVRSGEPFVYAYYDGLDKVAHEYGLGEHYDAELAAIDLFVQRLAELLPPGAALVVTADHGQVEVGDRVLPPAPEVLSLVDHQSGEARFRWLHALPGAEHELLEAAAAHHGDVAWVCSREEAVMKGWFGPTVTEAAASRLGDVALVPFEPVAFDDPADTGPYVLVGRHGSLTPAEVRVPLLVLRR